MARPKGRKDDRTYAREAALAALEQRQRGPDGVITKLRELYQLQWERIHIDAAVEKKIGKLIPSLTQEVSAASKILERLHEVEIALVVAVPPEAVPPEAETPEDADAYDANLLEFKRA